MIVHTKNSTYEFNTDEKLVRRVRGAKKPTSTQGPDGVWKEYKEHSQPILGACLMIVWPSEEEGGDENEEEVELKTTRTSPVLQVEGL